MASKARSQVCWSDAYIARKSQQSRAEPGKLPHWSLQKNRTSTIGSRTWQTQLNSEDKAKSAALIPTEDINNQEPNAANCMTSKARSEVCCPDAYMARKSQQSRAEPAKLDWILSTQADLLHWSLQKTKTSTIRSRIQQTVWHLKQGAKSVAQMPT